MRRFTWHGHGNIRGVLPGGVVELSEDLAAYLLEHYGADALVVLSEDAAPPAEEAPAPPEPVDDEPPTRKRRKSRRAVTADNGGE